MVSTESGQVPPIGHLKTAVEDAYYAVFHGIQDMCADCFIGKENDPSTPDKAWLEAYRSLRHGVVYSACRHQDMDFFPEHIRSAADNIAYLQNARQAIEYHPRTDIDLEKAIFCVNIAEQFLDIIFNSSRKDRIAFSAWVAFERKGGVADARKRARSVNPNALDFDKS